MPHCYKSHDSAVRRSEGAMHYSLDSDPRWWSIPCVLSSHVMRPVNGYHEAFPFAYSGSRYSSSATNTDLGN